jgi:signal peptidase I
MQSSHSIKVEIGEQTIHRTTYRYTGKSMLPNFHPGQFLYLRPEVRGIRPGDVIVYRLEDKYVVHRVIGLRVEGYLTRGDNNNFIDDALVQPEQVMGIVDAMDTGQDMHSVSGGRKSLWVAQLRWQNRRLFNSIRNYIGAPYRWLRASHWIVKVWHPEIARLYLNSPDISWVKYIYHGRTVACWSPETRQLTCQKPFDLVIFPPK